MHSPLIPLLGSMGAARPAERVWEVWIHNLWRITCLCRPNFFSDVVCLGTWRRGAGAGAFANNWREEKRNLSPDGMLKAQHRNLRCLLLPGSNGRRVASSPCNNNERSVFISVYTMRTTRCLRLYNNWINNHVRVWDLMVMMVMIINNHICTIQTKIQVGHFLFSCWLTRCHLGRPNVQATRVPVSLNPPSDRSANPTAYSPVVPFPCAAARTLSLPCGS